MSNSRKSFRKVAFATMAAASMVALAACSGGTKDAATEEESGEENKPEEATSEPVTIEYMHRLPDGEGMTSVEDIVAVWNDEHPDIQVKTVKFDGAASDMIMKLETDIKAGEGPCLAQTGYAEVPELFVKDLFEDVTEEAKKYEDHFSSGAFAMMRVGETIVGLPQDVGPLVYFYNEAEFEALGIEAPKHIDDLTAASEKAAEAGKYLTAFTPDEATYWLSAQAAAAGDEWFKAENDEWVVDTVGKGSEVVAEFWQNLLDKDLTLVEQRWGDGFEAALVDGSLIGHIGAAWETGFLLDGLDGTDAEGQWRVALLPEYGAGKMSGPDGGSGVSVMKGCEYPVQAMKFNDWFNTQIEPLTSQGLVVAAKGDPQTSEKALAQFGGQDVAKVLAEATESLNPKFVYMPGFSALSAMTATADNAAAGSTPVFSIFETAQSTAVETLTNLGLPVAE